MRESGLSVQGPISQGLEPEVDALSLTKSGQLTGSDHLVWLQVLCLLCSLQVHFNLGFHSEDISQQNRSAKFFRIALIPVSEGILTNDKAGHPRLYAAACCGRLKTGFSETLLQS